MTEAKPTPGPWSVQGGDVWCDWEGRPNAPLFRQATEYRRWGRDISPLERTANAHLIAETGTVYHETGFTPRELAEQRAELVEALEPFALIAEYDIGSDESDGDDYRPMQRHNVAPRVKVGHLRQALAALAKAKGGAA